MSLVPLADGFEPGELILYVLVLIAVALFGLLKRIATKPPAGKRPSEPAAPQRPPGSPTRPRPSGLPQAARRRPMPGARPPGARRPPAAPQMQPVTWDVEEELRRQLDRLQQDRAQRVQRLAAAPPPEADTAALEARLVHLRPVAGPTGAPVAAGPLADLTAPEALARAVLHYEIFAPPKALRPGPEMWEL